MTTYFGIKKALQGGTILGYSQKVLQKESEC